MASTIKNSVQTPSQSRILPRCSHRAAKSQGYCIHHPFKPIQHYCTIGSLFSLAPYLTGRLTRQGRKCVRRRNKLQTQSLQRNRFHYIVFCMIFPLLVLSSLLCFVFQTIIVLHYTYSVEAGHSVLLLPVTVPPSCSEKIRFNKYILSGRRITTEYLFIFGEQT